MANSLKFSEILQRLRRAKKWTISKAAKESGLTDDQWENLESGKHQPLAGTLVKATHGLGASMDVYDPEDFERCCQ
jgi:transcriptional regulator with XRE-family HTH domain